MNEETEELQEENIVVISQTNKRIKSNEGYYIGKEFEIELREYYNNDKISPKLGKIILDMVDGLAHNPKFINYTWIDDMRGDALMKIMKALERKNYSFDAGFSPFAYFNTIAWRAFLTRMKMEKERFSGEASYKEAVFREFYGEIGSYDDNDKPKMVDYMHYDKSKETVGMTDKEMKEYHKKMYKRRKKGAKKLEEIDDFVENELESENFLENEEDDSYFYQNRYTE